MAGNRPTEAYVPPNLSDTGSLIGGMFKMRNAVEAGIMFGLTFIVEKIVHLLIPSIYTTVVFLIIGALLGLIALMGVGGEPLSIFVLNCIIYRRVSGFCQLRMPLPKKIQENRNEEKAEADIFEDESEERDEARDTENSEEGGSGDWFERKIIALFYGKGKKNKDQRK